MLESNPYYTVCSMGMCALVFTQFEPILASFQQLLQAYPEFEVQFLQN
jgi:hypothetical protein